MQFSEEQIEEIIGTKADGWNEEEQEYRTPRGFEREQIGEEDKDRRDNTPTRGRGRRRGGRGRGGALRQLALTDSFRWEESEGGKRKKSTPEEMDNKKREKREEEIGLDPFKKSEKTPRSPVKS